MWHQQAICEALREFEQMGIGSIVACCCLITIALHQRNSKGEQLCDFVEKWCEELAVKMILAHFQTYLQTKNKIKLERER